MTEPKATTTSGENKQNAEKKHDLTELSTLAWVTVNGIVNENRKPIEFNKHRFMIELYDYEGADLVGMKSAQVGWTVWAILKSAHLNLKRDMNVIYVLPTRNVADDLVIPKVDPMIEENKLLRDSLVVSSKKIKQFGDRFTYFRGAWTEREAISISGDVFISDEHDRSDQKIINVYDSRLQASEYAWRWRFSNPSIPGYGVHELYQQSDQRHWFVKCHHCGHWIYQMWERDDEQKTHYIDQEKEIYACGNCHKELSDADRINGEWVAKYKGREMRGYWINQMLVPWVTAKRIIKQYKESTPEFFHNFVLGLPYQAAELLINRETLLKATTPGEVAYDGMVLGVDNGIVKHWVLGNAEGVLEYGETEDWEFIENLIVQHNAITVIDANPYPDIPVALTKKYRGQVFINYYAQDTKQLGTIRYREGDDRGVINTDRTKIFDMLAGEIVNRHQRFRMTHNEMTGMIYHWSQMYRVVEENSKQIKKGVWLTKEGKPDHWCHAMVYMRIAMDRLLRFGDAGIIKHKKPDSEPQGLTVKNHEDGRQSVDHNIDIMEIAKGTGVKKKSWKN